MIAYQMGIVEIAFIIPLVTGPVVSFAVESRLVPRSPFSIFDSHPLSFEKDYSPKGRAHQM